MNHYTLDKNNNKHKNTYIYHLDQTSIDRQFHSDSLFNVSRTWILITLLNSTITNQEENSNL